MKTLIVHNPTERDIIDYRVSEAKIDPDTGDAIINTGTGLPAETGRTLEWTIKAGETLEFPAYVARYLQGVYGFLQVSEKQKAEEPKEEVLEEPAKLEETAELEKPETPQVTSTGFMCKFCGKSFATEKGLGMHMGRAHAEELVKL